MKASRGIGVLIVLAAAFAAAYWIGGPPASPGEEPHEKGAPQQGPRADMGEEPMQEPGGDPQMPPGPPGDQQQMPDQMQRPPQDAQMQPGQYNPALLPSPSPSYNDDPQRFVKNYQTQAKLASPYWKKLSTRISDPQLAGECKGFSERLMDPNTDPLETTQAGILLENKIRQNAQLDDQTRLVLDYLNQVTATVIQDGDPSAIPRPK